MLTPVQAIFSTDPVPYADATEAILTWEDSVRICVHDGLPLHQELTPHALRLRHALHSPSCPDPIPLDYDAGPWTDAEIEECVALGVPREDVMRAAGRD